MKAVFSRPNRSAPVRRKNSAYGSTAHDVPCRLEVSRQRRFSKNNPASLRSAGRPPSLDRVTAIDRNS